VQIQRLDIIQGSGQEWQFEASVGTGTYMRSVVRDWGFLCGHSAHLERLERTQVGRFYEENGWTLETLRSLSVPTTALQPFSDILEIPQVEIDPPMQNAVRHGQYEVLNRLQGLNAPVVALTLDGDIMALVDGFSMRYIKVLIKDEPYATH
jgi:tRNA pseudouridine55 synthase